MVQWLKMPACKVGDRGFEPRSGLQVSKKQKNSFHLTRKDLIFWVLWEGSSSHHPQEVLLAQFSLYVHKCDLKPHSFHFSYRHIWVRGHSEGLCSREG